MIDKRSATIPGLSFLFILLSLGTVSGQVPTSRSDLDFKRERQKQVQTDTDQTVRRVGTMLRVLDYYQLDKRSERQLLDEVAGTLAGLSKAEMNEVIARLEAAAKAADEKRSSKETERAYTHHREIIDQLKKILARYDAVKNLDQVAKQLEQTAKQQHELSLRSSQMAEEWRRATTFQRGRMQVSRMNVQREIYHAADEENDLKRDTTSVLTQIQKLREQLPPEPQQRVRQAEDLARKLQVLDKMTRAAEALAASAENPIGKLKTSVADQRQAAENLQELARTLRNPVDRLAALREARDRVANIIQSQEELRRQGEAVVRQPRPQQHAQQARERGDRQGRLEHAAHVACSVLAPQDQDVGKRIAPAEQAMRQAEEALRKGASVQAARPQTEAAQTLRAVHKDLERRIAEAEKERGDPLAALQKATEQVDRLIQEQKDLRDKAAEATTTNKPKRLPAMIGKQQDLAKRTAQLNQEPSPARPAVQTALAKAAESMEQASKTLHDQKGKESIAHQDQALRNLEKAREDLAQQAAVIAKRRQEIAALEKAAERLDHLVKEQDKLASAAQERTQQNESADTKDLAQQQDALEAEAKDVGKQVEQAVAEAGKKVDEAATEMKAARGSLNQNKAVPGAKEARAATGKLKDAQKALARALDEKHGADLAEQAAMRPADVDAANAADQIAKALAQTKESAVQSEQAAAQQKGLREASQALARSQRATQEAMTALAQAQAQAPPGVQRELQQADAELSQAEQQLQQTAPTAANRSQQAAAAHLSKALQAMNATLAAMGQQPRAPSGPGRAAALGQKPGQGKGKGQTQGQSMARGPAQERNGTKGNGNRVADGKMSNTASELREVAGAGSFLHLPPRQRDMVRQALTSKLPAQYAAMIQQYFVNLASGKPASPKSQMRNPKSERKAK